jgi:hypothetical protein
VDNLLAGLIVFVVVATEFGVPAAYLVHTWHATHRAPKAGRVLVVFTLATVVQAFWGVVLILPTLAVVWFRIPGIAVFTFSFVWLALGGVVTWRVLERFVDNRGATVA